MTYLIEDLSTGSGITALSRAGETLERLKTIHLDSGGNWVYSNASAEATMPTIGLTLEAIPAGKKGTILLIGKIQNNNWNWTPGSILYTSKTDGDMTESIPNQSGDQVQAVGKALSQTLILFNPSYVLVEVA